jgi:hypothetical protein
MKRVVISALAVPFMLSGCLGGGSNPIVPNPLPAPSPSPSPSPSPAPAPADISEPLQLNGGSSTGLSISATATITDFHGPAEAVTINSVSGPNPATVTVTPSGTITSVDLSTPNARRVASGTVTIDDVGLGSDLGACAHGGCGSLRHLYLYNLNPLGTSFQYLTWGNWSEDSGSSGTVNSVDGFLVVGQPTPPANIPTSGTATYTGPTYGRFANPATSYVGSFEANFSATANFSARTLAVSTSGMAVAEGGPPLVSRPEHNYSGTLSYSAGSNQFSGPVTTPSGGTGTATGQFFGPAAQEIGGVVDISIGTIRAIGTFSGKQ